MTTLLVGGRVKSSSLGFEIAISVTVAVVVALAEVVAAVVVLVAVVPVTLEGAACSAAGKST